MLRLKSTLQNLSTRFSFVSKDISRVSSRDVLIGFVKILFIMKGNHKLSQDENYSWRCVTLEKITSLGLFNYNWMTESTSIWNGFKKLKS